MKRLASQFFRRVGLDRQIQAGSALQRRAWFSRGVGEVAGLGRFAEFVDAVVLHHYRAGAEFVGQHLVGRNHLRRWNDAAGAVGALHHLAATYDNPDSRLPKVLSSVENALLQRRAVHLRHSRKSGLVDWPNAYSR